MANQWFRLYAEFATDPKVQMMSEANQRRFIMVLCLRCSNDDVTLQDEEVAFQLRISIEEWATTKALFLSKGLLDENNTPAAWDKRQFVSDSSAERVRKHREAKKKASSTACNGRNVTETPPEAEAEAEAEVNPPFDKQQRKAEREEGREDGRAAPPSADPITSRSIELAGLLLQRGAKLTATNPEVRRWAADGVTDGEALQALEIAQQRRETKADPSPIPANYLSPILRDIRSTPPGGGARASPRDTERQARRKWAEELTTVSGQGGKDDGRTIDV